MASHKTKSKIQRLLKTLDESGSSENPLGLSFFETEPTSGTINSVSNIFGGLDSSSSDVSFSTINGLRDSSATSKVKVGAIDGNHMNSNDKPHNNNSTIKTTTNVASSSNFQRKLNHGNHDVTRSVISDNDTSSSFDSEYLVQKSPLIEKVILLERKIEFLVTQNRDLKSQAAQALAEKDAERSTLIQSIEALTQELDTERRAAAAQAPLMNARLEGLRNQLSDLRISETRAAELRALPANGRHIMDDLRLEFFDATAAVRADATELRAALEMSREAAARADTEAARLRAEAARLTATLAERERDLTDVAEGLQARVARLASELEASLLRAELNSAKGQMYDELRTQYNASVKEVQRLQVVEASFVRLEKEYTELSHRQREREHADDVLRSDKTHLMKQVEMLEMQTKRLEAAAAAATAREREAEKARATLWQQLLEERATRGGAEEERRRKEVERVREQARADLEHLRTESQDCYDRECRLLRELRDRATEEATRLRCELLAARDGKDAFAAAAAEAARRSDLQISDLQSDLRQRTYELEHSRIVMAEKDASIERQETQIQNLL
eukprot:CAMPEP_0175074876 /NCGR_PEP_ID=MMETSP0052_2-20121109/21610_1 /TAXON_ID=51329 ORGANISM="Polytomella parva, Strain SAG 63-3" /NCGR_SAMPLE_ID=MMETSP0052_2 /ASSEMBLY_ACC=CAM_ASM_000194 /LENGTH=564 /DNA_ID=CAMNT_0016343343 /DNA_START=126 /DNA_END=1816 /DNA_ORIENTATION=+